MNIDELDSKVSSAIANLQSTWAEAKSGFESGTEGLNKELQDLRDQNKVLQTKYDEAQAKIDKIENQLSKTVEQMESMSKATDKGIDAMQLLDVYLILMENVFESQAHTRLLIMLHGAKDRYTMNELSTASGISGVQVRQAIFDLRNSGIVDFNEDTDEITLKMRFME